MIPIPGRIVAYTLTEQDAEQVNRRRHNAQASGIAGATTGAMVHFGNPVAAGEAYPLVITRAWTSNDGGAVNGQVLLDGNDTLWVTSRTQGDEPGDWDEYPEAGA